MRRIFFLVILVALTFSSGAFADPGILGAINTEDEPEAGALRMAQMEVRVAIDNGMADVAILQIFENESGRMVDGEYEFALPEGAELSSFALWDDGVRIPGVILERERARETYLSYRAQMIDPGLVESAGENPGVFTCRVFPIEAYGTKRLELTYTQPLPVAAEKMSFRLPLAPAYHEEQKTDRFDFHLEFKSGRLFGEPVFRGETLIPQISDRSAEGFRASFSGGDLAFREDIILDVPYLIQKTELGILTYRDVDRIWRKASPTGGIERKDAFGFWGARVYFGREETAASSGPRQMVVAVDTSLSMQWDKLDRAMALTHAALTSLSAGDSFDVVTFNERPEAMTPLVAPWSTDASDKAEQWIRSGSISGGTDFVALFDAIAKCFNNAEGKQAVLITDGAPTLTEIGTKALVESYRKSKLAGSGARIFAIAVGDDANGVFLSDLALLGGGSYLHVGSTEDDKRSAEIVSDRLKSEAVEDVDLRFEGVKPEVRYPKVAGIGFGGSSLDFVGRYLKPGRGKAVLQYSVRGQKRKIETPVVFPDKSDDHPGLRRTWARARVDELLSMIEREGEREEWITEIVDLSREFTFVTPYTSFLAAPRALLRPRVIRPGDPILRVKADPRIIEVIASFPFGLTERMRYIESEDIWQIRFLAPPGWDDGTYECRLYLTDQDGRRYEETKRFVIDGRPPRIFPKALGTVRAGQSVELVAAADSDTRRLSARFPHVGTVPLRYDAARLTSVGTLDLPDRLAPGPYDIEWFAEDFAHNVTRLVTRVEVTADE